MRTIASVRWPVVAVAIMTIAAHGAFAQQSWLSSDSVSSASADPYARYHPLRCEFIPAHAELRYWREKLFRDTIYTPPLNNPWQHATMDEVRACIQRVPIETATARQAFGLANAYLIVADSTKAEAAFQRFLTLGIKQPIADRAWDMYLVVQSYLSSRSVEWSKASEYAAKLDALGAPAAAIRMLARADLYDQASVMDSLPLMEAQVVAWVKAGGDLTGDDRREWGDLIASAFGRKADLLARRGHPDSAIATLRQAADDLGALGRGIRDQLLRSTWRYVQYGKPAPKLMSSFTYAPGQPVSTSSTTGLPAVGKVSLLLFVSPSCGGECRRWYAVARRLVERYGRQGFEVTFVTKTGGYVDDRLVKPAEEADSINALFHGLLQLPVNLVVWATEFGRNADGRLRIRAMPNDQAYMGPEGVMFPGTAILVDKKGMIRYIKQDFKWMDEQRFRAMIADLLKL